MSWKPTPQKISDIVQRYIDKYQAEIVKKDEYIYQLQASECGEFADFLRSDTGRAYLSFYPLSPQEYDEKSNEFMFASFYEPKFLGLKDGKIKLELNVVIPTRDGYVDKAQVVEIIAHELNHAYMTWNEVKQKHISNPIGIVASMADLFKKLKNKPKYTYSEKMQNYTNILPTNSGSVYDDFRWVGYTGTQTEINANLAGIDAFLFENNGDISKLPQSRGWQTMQIVRQKLNKLKNNNNIDDWRWAQKNATYIYNRKDESVVQFKNRYIKYYENVFNEFDKKIEKILNKHHNKSEKFKHGRGKLASGQIVRRINTQHTK